MRTEVRLSGFGGQGIIMAGVILGKAASLYDKKEAVQTQSYGPEARGGASKSEVIIADQKINYPKINNTGILVAMSQPAYHKFKDKMHQDGTLLVDGDLVSISDQDRVELEKKKVEIIKVPATKIAGELGRKVIANIVMLGVLAVKTGVVSQEAVKEAVASSVPPHTIELNLKALQAGFAVD